MADCIIMNPQDNVATLIKKVRAGDVLDIADTRMEHFGRVTAIESIPFAHKICLKDLKRGDLVIKYGQIIGRASADIPCGSYAHVHNVISIEGSEQVASSKE